MVLQNKEQSCDLLQTVQCELLNTQRVESIAAYNNNKGFIVSGTSGYFGVYERTDDRKDPFILIKNFQTVDHETISSITISPSDESVVGYMKSPSNQLFHFPLVNIDMMKETDQSSHFHSVRKHGMHTGPVIGMDVCVNKPYLISIGIDKTARVWNYLTWNCEISHEFSEDPTCIAAHPAGFQCIVGFKERVSMFNILMDDLKPCREMQLKHCKAVTFCNGGHMFACAIGISVMVFNTAKFENISSMTGHIRPVRSLSWSADDRLLYSAGVDGSVYGWDAASGRREEENMQKACQFRSLVCDRSMVAREDGRNGGGGSGSGGGRDNMADDSYDNDGSNSAGNANAANNSGPLRPRSVVAVGSDGKIHNIRNGDATSISVQPKGVMITQVIVNHANSQLFAGTSEGCVRVYSWPLSPDASHFVEYKLHNGPVTSLQVTPDDFYLFSASEDGTMFAMQMIQVQ